MASCHFYLAGTGMYQIGDTLEQILFTTVFMTGMMYFMYIAALVFQVFNSVNVSENKFQEIMYQLHEYCLSKQLPSTLKHRMLMYYENKFQKHYFKEQAILMTLSEHFRDELFLFCTKRLLDKVPIFDGLSRCIIGDLSESLKQDVFLPNDVIYKANTTAEAMYFIVHGSVTFLLANGNEVCHFKDGDHFGEGSLIVKKKHHQRMCTALAIEMTECLRLDKADLYAFMARYGEFASKMTIVARNTFTELSARTKQMSSDEADAHSVGLLHDLRHGKILLNRVPRPPLIRK